MTQQAFWIEARWGGKPACARCSSTRVWTERDGSRTSRIMTPDYASFLQDSIYQQRQSNPAEGS
jgi:hypothetical protein